MTQRKKPKAEVCGEPPVPSGGQHGCTAPVFLQGQRRGRGATPAPLPGSGAPRSQGGGEKGNKKINKRSAPSSTCAGKTKFQLRRAEPPDIPPVSPMLKRIKSVNVEGGEADVPCLDAGGGPSGALAVAGKASWIPERVGERIRFHR